MAVDDARPPARAREGDTRLASHDLHRHIPDEGQGRDDDREQPDLRRIDGIPWVDGPVRQQGQRQERHREKDERGSDFQPGQTPKPAVKWLLEGQDERDQDTGRDGDFKIAENRVSAQGEGEEAGDDAGDAEILLRLRLEPGEGAEREREPEKGQRQKDGVGVVRQDCGQGAEQGDEGVGPQARRPLAFRLLALLPAALQADEQADGQGNGKTEKQRRVVHGTWVT